MSSSNNWQIANGSRFYVTGGTLSPDALSYVERQADVDLLQALEHGEFCYVLHARQMGKSSLMVRTAARLREAGIRVAVLDLTQIGKNLTPEQWYGGLLVSLGEQIGLTDELDAFWLSNTHLGPLQRWIAALEHIVLAERKAQSAERREQPDQVAIALPGEPRHRTDSRLPARGRLPRTLCALRRVLCARSAWSSSSR